MDLERQFDELIDSFEQKIEELEDKNNYLKDALQGENLSVWEEEKIKAQIKDNTSKIEEYTSNIVELRNMSNSI